MNLLSAILSLNVVIAASNSACPASAIITRAIQACARFASTGHVVLLLILALVQLERVQAVCESGLCGQHNLRAEVTAQPADLPPVRCSVASAWLLLCPIQFSRWVMLSCISCTPALARCAYSRSETVSCSALPFRQLARCATNTSNLQNCAASECLLHTVPVALLQLPYIGTCSTQIANICRAAVRHGRGGGGALPRDTHSFPSGAQPFFLFFPVC